MAELVDDVRVIDADTHMTERHDLFTSRAPEGYEDRVPRVTTVDGIPTWTIEGAVLGPARAGGVIDRDGQKFPFEETKVWGIENVHEGAWDPEKRLAVMDETGIHAQVVYPNAVGIGGQNLAKATDDPVLRRLCVEIYNDSMAELQEWSNRRFLPMPVLPAWSVEECVAEANRCADLDFRGVNMTSDPQETGAPDLASREWDPLWEVCADRGLPVHFHIGASLTALTFYGQYFWPSLPDNMKPAVGGSMLFLNNARVIINSAYAGIFDRHPKLKMVSVESGIGWIPFILETMDYEVMENAPEQAAELSRMPSEYFADHWYATFWFERAQGDLQGLIDKVGEDNVMFETDFPHPTCLYPDPLGTVGEVIGSLRPGTQRKVLGDNAAALYRL
ncbi:MAG: amidohydrolase [Acidimicrobiales bacterium]|nr:amidohydrolase [Acidimicrobiales bacterium]MCB1016696.1 amidohydrolase [Acidimicrobiales bacterium]